MLGASQSGVRSSLRLLRVLDRRRGDRARPATSPSGASPPTRSSTDPALADIVAEMELRRPGTGWSDVSRSATVSRIIAGSPRRPSAQPCRPAPGPGRPPTGSARPCSRRSPSWAGTAGGPRRRGAGRAGLLRSVRRLRRGRPGGGQPGRRPGAAGRGGPADRRRSPAATSATSGWPPRSAPGRSSRWSRAASRAGYDIVFADPPYELADTALDAVLPTLVAHGWVAAGRAARRRAVARTAEPAWPAPVADTWSRALR